MKTFLHYRYLALVVMAIVLLSVSRLSAQGSSIRDGRRAENAKPVGAGDRQDFLDWRFGMFLHFNMGTFVGLDWANGHEDPAVFAPSQLDCGQWADVAKAAGMRYGVLTVKHTGAWCLWDSAHTTHDITALKNYRNGKGDIVRQYVDAFRSRGLKVGLYYCFPGDYARPPAGVAVEGKPDLHGLPPEAAGDYVGFIKKQLAELLTNYGPIDLLWIDQYRNKYTASAWPEIRAHIKKLQPRCVLVANNARSLDVSDVLSYEFPWRPELPPEDNALPAEVSDTLLTHSRWFWHAGLGPDDLQSVEAIVKKVKLCNSRHANYLLNVPPDRTGRIPAAWAARLQQVGKELEGQTPEDEAEGVELVRDNKAVGCIVVAAKEPALVKEAAELVVRVIEKRTGVRLALKSEPPQDMAVLRITADSPDPDLDKDGYLISSPSSEGIVVSGGSEWGAMFGTQELLERYLGVRWLFPGEVGDYIPKSDKVLIPRVTVRETPAFFSRQVSGHAFAGSRQKNPLAMWLMRARMHGRMSFHHNLLHLFPPDTDGKSHPEFFPVVNGTHRVPSKRGDYNWQPVLDANGIVEEAVDRINVFFDTHEATESYSLGMNDTHAWDDAVMKGDVRRNSIGKVDLSDYYFRWASQVAEGVLKKHPDKWFGCLAYNELTDPPRQVKVNAHILPYVCIDRMMWADPAARKADIDRTHAWLKVAPRLAWYDYIYGDQFYKLPRVYPHLMGEYLRFANENGVVAYYAEAYPTAAWSEGPKLYVFFKLLWDPTRDVDAMLDEWCNLAVGRKAAPHLRAYYAFWEDFWTRRVPTTDWFTNGVRRTCYLPMHGTGYFDALEVDDLDRCEAWMSQVKALAQTQEEKARAEFLFAGWERVKQAMEDCIELLRYAKEGPPRGMHERRVFLDDCEDAGKQNVRGGLPRGWSYWQRVGSKAQFVWDRSAGDTNPGALRIAARGSDGQPLCFLKKIHVEPRTFYRARCRIRTNGIDPAATVGVTLKWQDANGKWLTQFSSAQSTVKNRSDGQWQSLDFYFCTPPSEQPRLVYMLLVEGAKDGQAWFDDIELGQIVAEQE